MYIIEYLQLNRSDEIEMTKKSGNHEAEHLTILSKNPKRTRRAICDDNKISHNDIHDQRDINTHDYHVIIDRSRGGLREWPPKLGLLVLNDFISCLSRPSISDGCTNAFWQSTDAICSHTKELVVFCQYKY